MDTLEQMQLAERMTRLLVAELREGGVAPTAIAAILCAFAGSLYREGLAPENVRPAIEHMAENMITGTPH